MCIGPSGAESLEGCTVATFTYKLFISLCHTIACMYIAFVYMRCMYTNPKESSFSILQFLLGEIVRTCAIRLILLPVFAKLILVLKFNCEVRLREPKIVGQILF